QELAELRAVCSRREQGAARLKAKQAGASLLTPREREVFILARDRLSAKEISARLCISIHTVNTILKNIYRKLKVGSKADLKSIRAF
ncbi:MAG: helix-turn-helix transcriptional regulator, partial [Desulfovibrio sp.]|nr:helix-turn-helix transcriptional regulator [Desulfovibrio sp.]